MSKSFRYITTEQVSKYHPDKYADQISDAIVTKILELSPNSKVAVETLVKDTTVVVAGEIGLNGSPLLDEYILNDIIEEEIHRVAYSLRYDVTNIINLIGKQSLEIRGAVEQDEIGAGDQGIMFGYATRETPSLLPLGVHIANEIIAMLEKITKANNHEILKGDAKTQVTIDDETKEIKTIVISVCHDKDLSLNEVKDLITKHTYSLLGNIYDLTNTEFIINPGGAWTIGGPTADSGLTGRKIVADQYGPYAPVGGGAFSGKDLTKVDRSAAYIARAVAVETLLANESLEWIKVHVGYAIGKSYPVSISILSNEGELTEDLKMLRERFKVSNMIKELSGLNLYELSKGCHFREGTTLGWEKTNR